MRTLSVIPGIYLLMLLVLVILDETGPELALAHLVAVVVGLTVLVRTLRHVQRNPALSPAEREHWTKSIYIIGVVTAPLYVWRHWTAAAPTRRHDV